MKKKLLLPLLASASLLAFSASVSAHATFDKRKAKEGSYQRLALGVPHGCEGSPTVSVNVKIPEGVLSVKPQPKPGWNVHIKKGAYQNTYENHGESISEGVLEITWDGGRLLDEHFDEFKISAKMPKTPGKTAFFVVTQECEVGEVSWKEIPTEGQDPHSLKRPAPGIKITAKKHKGGHGKMGKKKDGKMKHGEMQMKHGEMKKKHGEMQKKHGEMKKKMDHSAMGKMVNSKVAGLELSNGWVRAVPPVSKTTAAYINIENTNAHADELLGASSSIAKAVEIHEVVDKNDVMVMQRVNKLEVPAQGKVMLKPGGYHIMFIGLDSVPKEGEKVHLTLNFKNAGEVMLVLPVKAGGQMNHNMKH